MKWRRRRREIETNKTQMSKQIPPLGKKNARSGAVLLQGRFRMSKRNHVEEKMTTARVYLAIQDTSLVRLAVWCASAPRMGQERLAQLCTSPESPECGMPGNECATVAREVEIRDRVPLNSGNRLNIWVE
eukprot:gene17577-biopygen15916